MTHVIDLADRFPYPFGRYRDPHGQFSGEVFREEVLLPAFQATKTDTVEVNLDNARGLSPSFLEEAFGGLVRRGVSAREVLQRLVIRSDRDPSFIQTIKDYVNQAR